MNFWIPQTFFYILCILISQSNGVRAMGDGGGPVFVEAISDFRWDLNNVSRETVYKFMILSNEIDP